MLRLLLVLFFLSKVDGFATPKSEFLLDIDGNSIGTSLQNGCAIEQKPGNEIGGRVKCWGLAKNGRVGVPEDIDFVQIALGYQFTCGVTLDRTVFCWGKISGQIPGIYSQITSTGKAHFACGIRVGGSINCWGTSFFLSKYPKSGKYVQISCSDDHCCALDDKGYPVCWSETELQSIFPPTITYREYLESKTRSGWIIKEEIDEFEEEDEAKTKDDEVALVQFRQISVGFALSCGVTLFGGHILCWGEDEHIETHYDNFPKQIKGPFRQISVGDMGICAITADDVESRVDIEDETGIAESGQVHKEESEDRYPPDSLLCWGKAQQVVDTKKYDAWDQVKVGCSNVCAISMDSDLECWGITAHYKSHYQNIIIA